MIIFLAFPATARGSYVRWDNAGIATKKHFEAHRRRVHTPHLLSCKTATPAPDQACHTNGCVVLPQFISSLPRLHFAFKLLWMMCFPTKTHLRPQRNCHKITILDSLSLKLLNHNKCFPQEASNSNNNSWKKSFKYYQHMDSNNSAVTFYFPSTKLYEMLLQHFALRSSIMRLLCSLLLTDFQLLTFDFKVLQFF